VLDFRKSLEESRQVLSQGFANEAEFKAEVDCHLRAFAKGELPPADAPRDKVLLPLAARAELGLDSRCHLINNEWTSGRINFNQVGPLAVGTADLPEVSIGERAQKVRPEVSCSSRSV
jgi:hypothetical protein